MNFPMNYDQFKFHPHEYSSYSGSEYEGRRNNDRNNDDREINNLIATIFNLCCNCKTNDSSEEEDNSL